MYTRKRWSYDVKKRNAPENVSDCQETLPNISEKGIIRKGASPVPVLGSFGGMIFSGCVFGITETIIISIPAVIINCIYYFQPMLNSIFDYRLKREDQKYKYSIPKADANAHELRKRQMELAHEYRMKKLEISENKYSGFNDDSVIPPADVTEDHPKYLS